MQIRCWVFSTAGYSFNILMMTELSSSVFPSFAVCSAADIYREAVLDAAHSLKQWGLKSTRTSLLCLYV